MFFLMKQVGLYAAALFSRVRALKKFKDKGVSWHQGYPVWASSWSTTKVRGSIGSGLGFYLEWGGGRGTKMEEIRTERLHSGLSYFPAL